MIRNSKGQESGTLQNLLIALLLVTTVAYFAVGYMNGISVNYGVELNESQYSVFEKFGEVNSTISSMTDQFVNADAQQTDSADIITAMISSAYGLIVLVFDLPDLFLSLVTSGIAALGIAPAQAAALSGLVVGFVIILILFAVVALIMKVRA